jgi:hypothetical protein
MPANELAALAGVYAFTLECHVKKAAAGIGGENDTEVRSTGDFRADKAILPN